MPRRPNAEINVTDPDAERLLVQMQRKIARAQRLTAERNDLLEQMSRSGYTQFRLAGLINSANAREGQPPITDDAVFKNIKRARLAKSGG
jgi:hypothetical protein